jgi:thymidylate synthase (FAD)
MRMMRKKKSQTNQINLLNNGYVRLVSSMGSDLSVVNAARASYAKESFEVDEKDKKLIKFLAKEGHWSPFRHAFLTFEFKAPLMVARQHWKYVVGSDHTMDSWNESSRRYITSDPDFYIPEADRWRLSPENSKQGSGDFMDIESGRQLTSKLIETLNYCMDNYEAALNDMDVAPEQARLFLPAYGMNVMYRWSCSLQSVGLFLKQRLHDTAQYEISLYAKAVHSLVEPIFPISINSIMEFHDA